MGDKFQQNSWGVNELHLPSESYYREHRRWDLAKNNVLQPIDNLPGISSAVVPSQISDGSTAQLCPSPNISNGPGLERNMSSVSKPEQALGKRKIGQADCTRTKKIVSKPRLNRTLFPSPNQPGISSGVVPSQIINGSSSTAESYPSPNNSGNSFWKGALENHRRWGLVKNNGLQPIDNLPGISSGVVPSQISDGSTAQLCPSPNISNCPGLERNMSSVSKPEQALGKRKIGQAYCTRFKISNGSTAQELTSPNISNGPVPEQTQKKRKADQEYRKRCKNHKMEMQSKLEHLQGENYHLKQQYESVKKDNALINQTLREREKENEELKNGYRQLQDKCDKQNVLVEALSGLSADPVKLEIEKLKDENASLRKNANLNSDLSQLVDANERLTFKYKRLKVQNDALCGMIIRTEKHEAIN